MLMKNHKKTVTDVLSPLCC